MALKSAGFSGPLWIVYSRPDMTVPLEGLGARKRCNVKRSFAVP
jgi:hypothetical protein